jgi:hypothetical protein
VFGKRGANVEGYKMDPTFPLYGRSLGGRKYCSPLLLYPSKRKWKILRIIKMRDKLEKHIIPGPLILFYF